MADRRFIRSLLEKDTSAGRLQSLRLPRDLSLGIKPKKPIIPNLNVTRNRERSKETAKKVEPKRKETPSRERRANSDRYVQSAGVFSQGIGDTHRPNIHSQRRVSFREPSTASALAKPKVIKNDWMAVKREIDDSEIDYDLEGAIGLEDDVLKPLSIGSLSTKDKPIIKKQIKKESDSDDTKCPEIAQLETKVKRLSIPFIEPEAYSHDNPALVLVKMPDSLAGKGLSDDPNIKTLFDYPLTSMLEGQIGNLVIRKSGKIEVQIGSAKYHMEPVETSAVKEELATVVQQAHGQTSMAILGNILENYVLYPDYANILDT